MSVLNKIKKLTEQLYPTGRAFKIPKESFFEKLIEALNESEKRAYDDAVSTIDSVIADNDDFTEADATDWERRLGLITGEGVSLEDRKLAILRKYNHPGEIKARNHYLFLQKQLRDAGFDVYVHENRFDYGDGTFYTLSPRDIDPSYPISNNMYSPYNQYGQLQYGGTLGNKVVNHINESLDAPFNIGSSFRASFFIGGPYLGDWAIVDLNRKNEFRQIILKTKPTQTVGFLFVNFY